MRKFLAGLAALGLLIAACGGPAPSATPGSTLAAQASAPSSSRSPTNSLAVSSPAPSLNSTAWLRAANVDQPVGFLTTGAVDCGCQKHPAIDTLTTGVTNGPAGLVAVGWILQGWIGASWRSIDGSSWQLTQGFPAKSLLSAVAANSGRYVAIGLDGNGATVWTSTTGATWQRVNSSAFAGIPLRLNSITPWRGGFVAGGYRGNEFFSADAELWVSPDGLSWRRATDSPAFRDARVSGVAASTSGLVAVGQSGPADHPGPAIVWTSHDGVAWTRVLDGPVFANGRMRAVAAVPAIGFVAVGDDLAGDTGIIWTSREGRTWTRVPADPGFGRPGIQVRMYTVTAGPNGAVVGGTFDAGIQYGQAVIWTSSDGLAWTRVPNEPAFQDAEVAASTEWNGRVVAVGDRGAPDAYQATMWLSPTGGH